MNNDLSQKYYDEMMKYYNKQKKNNPESNPPSSETPESDATISNPSNPEISKPKDLPDPVSVRYPEPDISQFIMSETEPAAFTEKTPVPDGSDYGSLRIEASAGSRAIPVEDVLIIITRAEKPDEILAMLLTDSNGATQTIRIPAPAEMLSESPSDKVVNTVVNITAFKKGYYEVENRNVPVFTGVTSIQPVNMIPLPLNTSEGKTTFTESKPNL